MKSISSGDLNFSLRACRSDASLSSGGRMLTTSVSLFGAALRQKPEADCVN